MSNMNFFQIFALKVFAELGQLIEDDENNQITVLDLPTDIIHNQISKYLLKDKSIDKIFNKKDDYYLPKFIVDHDKLTFLQAIKKFNYRMKNKNSDNLKPEEIKIDSLIDNVKNNK